MESKANRLLLLLFLVAFGAWSCSSGGDGSSDDGAGNGNGPTDPPPSVLDRLTLPAGFSISFFAESVNGARSLDRSPDGKVIFVGNRAGSQVTILVDDDLDGEAEARHTINSLDTPNGVVFHNGDLYVSEVSRVLKFEDILNNLENPGTPVVVFDGYPNDPDHGWKFISIGPDNKLYVPVGAPCNICERTDNEVYSSITRVDLDGSNFEVYAHGIRNSVGFDWHPETGNLWFTENGADQMGDDVPSCELNVVTEAGQHYGYPYWHAGGIADATYSSTRPREDFEVPIFQFEPHSAPLGGRFYEGEQFPSEYKNAFILAQHGSWNRSAAAGHTGYQVRTVFTNGNSVAGSQLLVSGWLDTTTNQYWGRPVDVLEMPDGSLLISDDEYNCVYRVTYDD